MNMIIFHFYFLSIDRFNIHDVIDFRFSMCVLNVKKLIGNYSC